MNNNGSALATVWIILIIVVVIGFPILIVKAIRKGSKEGKEFRAKVSSQNQQLKTMVHNANNDSSEQLRKLKGLLDDGVITQDEFDSKKKQILGI